MVVYLRYRKTNKTRKMKVISRTLGIGTVVSQDNKNVVVDFNGDVKTLITKFARLTNEDGTAFGEQFVSKKKKAKKLNKANFMTKEIKEYVESNKMSSADFIAQRRMEAFKTISW